MGIFDGMHKGGKIKVSHSAGVSFAKLGKSEAELRLALERDGADKSLIESGVRAFNLEGKYGRKDSAPSRSDRLARLDSACRSLSAKMDEFARNGARKDAKEFGASFSDYKIVFATGMDDGWYVELGNKSIAGPFKTKVQAQDAARDYIRKEFK